MLSKKVIDWNNDPSHCSDVTGVLLHTLRPVYSFYQLFIAFKYSNVSRTFVDGNSGWS